MVKNRKLIAHLFAHGKEPKESSGGSTDWGGNRSVYLH